MSTNATDLPVSGMPPVKRKRTRRPQPTLEDRLIALRGAGLNDSQIARIIGATPAWVGYLIRMRLAGEHGMQSKRIQQFHRSLNAWKNAVKAV